MDLRARLWIEHLLAKADVGIVEEATAGEIRRNDVEWVQDFCVLSGWTTRGQAVTDEGKRVFNIPNQDYEADIAERFFTRAIAFRMTANTLAVRAAVATMLTVLLAMIGAWVGGFTGIGVPEWVGRWILGAYSAGHLWFVAPRARRIGRLLNAALLCERVRRNWAHE